MSQNDDPPRESNAIPGARESVSFLAAENSRDVVLEWLVEHFSRGLMNVPENGVCGNNFKKRCPLLPRGFVNPFPSVEEVDSFEESVKHDDVVADDHFFTRVRLLFSAEWLPTYVE